jgi:hypothetical protein
MRRGQRRRSILAVVCGGIAKIKATPTRREARSSRVASMETYVTVVDVIDATGVKERTAYRYLTEARGGRPGRTTLVEWQQYADMKWGRGSWDDDDKEDRACGYATASGTRRSTTPTVRSSAPPAVETARKLRSLPGRGSARPLIPIIHPRRPPSTTP